MANQYGNLGNIYQTRGDLDEAEAMYRKALGLFRDVGAVLQVKHVQGLLEGLSDEWWMRNDG